MTEHDWERRLERLERRVETLERELRAQQGFAATMRATGQCRACGSRRTWHASQLRFPDSSAVLAIQYSLWGVATARFEADVCASCGAAELTVVDVGAVKEKGPVTLRVCPEPETPVGEDPFRRP